MFKLALHLYPDGKTKIPINVPLKDQPLRQLHWGYVYLIDSFF